MCIVALGSLIAGLPWITYVSVDVLVSLDFCCLRQACQAVNEIAPPPNEGLTKAHQNVQLAVAKQSKLPGLCHEPTRNLQKQTPEAAKSAHVSSQHTTMSLLNMSMWMNELAMLSTASHWLLHTSTVENILYYTVLCYTVLYTVLYYTTLVYVRSDFTSFHRASLKHLIQSHSACRAAELSP